MRPRENYTNTDKKLLWLENVQLQIYLEINRRYIHIHQGLPLPNSYTAMLSHTTCWDWSGHLGTHTVAESPKSRREGEGM